MNNNILIYFEVKSESIPKIIAHYLLNVSEWDFIKTKLKREFEFILDDSDLYGDKIIINQDNLSITEITNTKFIDAFRILHKNYFYTYDLLSFLGGSWISQLKKRRMEYLKWMMKIPT